jgi:hypothetical protein
MRARKTSPSGSDAGPLTRELAWRLARTLEEGSS